MRKFIWHFKCLLNFAGLFFVADYLDKWWHSVPWFNDHYVILFKPGPTCKWRFSTHLIKHTFCFGNNTSLSVLFLSTTRLQHTVLTSCLNNDLGGVAVVKIHQNISDETLLTLKIIIIIIIIISCKNWTTCMCVFFYHWDALFTAARYDCHLVSWRVVYACEWVFMHILFISSTHWYQSLDLHINTHIIIA